MSIFEKLGPRATEVREKAGAAAQAAAKTSKKLAASARVSLSITAENEKIKKAQIELGKLYYRDFTAGTEPEKAEYLPWCDKITSSLKTIDALNESLVAMEEGEPTVEPADEPAAAEESGEASEQAPEEAPTEAAEPAPEAEAPVYEYEETVVPAEEPPVSTLYVDETNAEA